MFEVRKVYWGDGGMVGGTERFSSCIEADRVFTDWMDDVIWMDLVEVKDDGREVMYRHKGALHGHPKNCSRQEA